MLKVRAKSKETINLKAVGIKLPAVDGKVAPWVEIEDDLAGLFLEDETVIRFATAGLVEFGVRDRVFEGLEIGLARAALKEPEPEPKPDPPADPPAKDPPASKTGRLLRKKRG